MKIYTKTGDKGKTSLFGGQRVSKADVRVEVYGTVDELNSAIGVAIAQVQSSKFKVQSYSSKLKSELEKIQHDLFDIGASLANPTQNKEYREKKSKFMLKRTEEFEKLIDDLTKEIPDFQCFVLPGVGKGGAYLHLCRTVCRRAERRIVELSKKDDIDNSILVYFNRLSDLLFTMARFANHKEKKKEIIWQEQV